MNPLPPSSDNCLIVRPIQSIKKFAGNNKINAITKLINNRLYLKNSIFLKNIISKNIIAKIRGAKINIKPSG